MNDPHYNLTDELLEDLLQPLHSVVPPVETQSANREAVRQALAMHVQPAWWRRTIAVPVPLAIAASIVLLLAAVTFVRPSAGSSSGEQSLPLSAARQGNPATQETSITPYETTTPAWTIQRSFIRTLTSSTATEIDASNSWENRDDS